MTTEQKTALVEAAWEAHGLNRALTAVDLPKSTWYYQRTQKVSYEDKYAHLQGALEEIARKHPEYGILRTTEELRDSHASISCGIIASCAVLDGRSPAGCGKPSSRPVNVPIW
jgi:hypothetical protein